MFGEKAQVGVVLTYFLTLKDRNREISENWTKEILKILVIHQRRNVANEDVHDGNLSSAYDRKVGENNLDGGCVRGESVTDAWLTCGVVKEAQGGGAWANETTMLQTSP